MTRVSEEELHNVREEARTLRTFANEALKRLQAATDVLERDGYRRCDTPACNCGSWHRHAKESDSK